MDGREQEGAHAGAMVHVSKPSPGPGWMSGMMRSVSLQPLLWLLLVLAVSTSSGAGQPASFSLVDPVAQRGVLSLSVAAELSGAVTGTRLPGDFQRGNKLPGLPLPVEPVETDPEACLSGISVTRGGMGLVPRRPAGNAFQLSAVRGAPQPRAPPDLPS